ncbi:hypothetical protein E3P77_02939 [Wallemia ichthyophaga]|nr:hypothetical protein E3P77_02939 [Wallemia ichthyophaga]
MYYSTKSINNAKSRANTSTTLADEIEDKFVTERDHNGVNNGTQEPQSYLPMILAENIPSYYEGYGYEHINSTETGTYFSSPPASSYQFQQPSMQTHYEDDQATTRLVSHGPIDAALLQYNDKSNFEISPQNTVALMDLHGINNYQYPSPSPYTNRCDVHQYPAHYCVDHTLADDGIYRHMKPPPQISQSPQYYFQPFFNQAYPASGSQRTPSIPFRISTETESPKGGVYMNNAKMHASSSIPQDYKPINGQFKERQEIEKVSLSWLQSLFVTRHWIVTTNPTQSRARTFVVCVQGHLHESTTQKDISACTMMIDPTAVRTVKRHFPAQTHSGGEHWNSQPKCAQKAKEGAKVEEDGKSSQLAKGQSPKARRIAAKKMLDISSDENENEERSEGDGVGIGTESTLPKASTSSAQKRSAKKRRIEKQSSEEISQYELQLEQVKETLTADPTNADLLGLKDELMNIIDLLKAASAPAPSASTSSQAESSRSSTAIEPEAVSFKAGEDVLAKYKDGKFYPATIKAVSGIHPKIVYTINFRGYQGTEQVQPNMIKAMDAHTKINMTNKRQRDSQKSLTSIEDDKEKDKKRKKNEKKAVVREQKNSEMNDKQNNWQKFAKKANKKGIHIAGSEGKSIFKTPDNPYGRVGVTGSGKPMTEQKTILNLPQLRPRNLKMGAEYFIGIDVGTGSARSALLSTSGDIIAESTYNTHTWRDANDANIFEQSSANIWGNISQSVRDVVKQAQIPKEAVKGIAFDATCSLAVTDRDGNPITVSNNDKLGKSGERNIILWADHRAEKEANLINSTGAMPLQFVGGTVSLEMEIPKTLWLKNHMDPEDFRRCMFFDLPDWLSYRATRSLARSNNSLGSKFTYVTPSISGAYPSGWDPKFLEQIGLGDLVHQDFIPIGGAPNKNGLVLTGGLPVGKGLTKEAAEELGLAEGTAVGSSVIDAYAGWIGTVAAKSAKKGEDLPKDAVAFEECAHRLAACAAPSNQATQSHQKVYSFKVSGDLTKMQSSQAGG